jgi:hypothetical protein
MNIPIYRIYIQCICSIYVLTDANPLIQEPHTTPTPGGGAWEAGGGVGGGGRGGRGGGGGGGMGGGATLHSFFPLQVSPKTQSGATTSGLKSCFKRVGKTASK